MQQTLPPLNSSFRDPSGFVFQKDGIIYRQVNKVFRENFDHFTNSGCYGHLVQKGWLIPHEEIPSNFSGSDKWYKTIRPRQIPFISFPYEWCFDMMKEAALLTLQLAKECIPFGVILKDATPYNIQWLDGVPVFIDTLSFEKYDASEPWIAYRQFCECFASPLLLMHYTGRPLQSLIVAFPEGIPLSITKALLPFRSKFSFHTFLHIHLHERIASKSTGTEQTSKNTFSEKKMLRLLESLQLLIKSLHWKGKPTNWGDYYEEANQRNQYVEQKKKNVSEWINGLDGVTSAIDLGCNEGTFSFVLAEKKIKVVATDFDHTAINKLYQKLKEQNETNILPLLADLANPSPAIGLNNRERGSFIERTKVNLALALALVHHLAIGKNIPFEHLAEFFGNMTDYLLIEFIPKSDEKIQFILRQKKDIYEEYSETNFVKAFERYFTIQKKREIADSGRILYMMKKHD